VSPETDVPRVVLGGGHGGCRLGNMAPGFSTLHRPRFNESTSDSGRIWVGVPPSAENDAAKPALGN
jgi:hypothetical protein